MNIQNLNGKMDKGHEQVTQKERNMNGQYGSVEFR